jgi:hypothetical protein
VTVEALALGDIYLDSERRWPGDDAEKHAPHGGVEQVVKPCVRVEPALGSATVMCQDFSDVSASGHL